MAVTCLRFPGRANYNPAKLVNLYIIEREILLASFSLLCAKLSAAAAEWNVQLVYSQRPWILKQTKNICWILSVRVYVQAWQCTFHDFLGTNMYEHPTEDE